MAAFAHPLPPKDFDEMNADAAPAKLGREIHKQGKLEGKGIELNGFDSGAEFAWDPIWLLALHGGPEFRIQSNWLHTLRIGGRFEFVLPSALTMSGGRFLLDASGERKLGRKELFFLSAGLSSGFIFAKDSTGQKYGFTKIVFFQPGLRRGRLRLSLDLRWRSVPFVNIQHSNLIHSTFEDRYPEGTNIDKDNQLTGPRDGWYRFSSHRFLLGLATQIRIFKRGYITFRGGWNWLPQAQGLLSIPELGQLPFYLRIGGKVRW